MIEAREPACRHPRGPLLRFPSFAVPAGGTLLLRGASGSGKSTLLALLAGLLTPDAGQVVVDGTDVGALPARERDAWRARTLGFLPQRLHLSDSLSVRDNLALALWAGGAAPPGGTEEIDALLARLGVAGLASRRPHELSGGQAQRVALARALLRRPRLLLADEPTASLDDAAAGAALDALQQAAGEGGATLVVATHDRRAVAALGERAQELLL
ncbi:ATP-binding cassette domain-containing protein [Caldimonas tepidiphila]|uniref:ATP-binding cassette domain-containing protein n=1 Tax=Caldimonas tepidiphila TaxID=2315841 RepID=UPI000E5B7555|nr:ATP-binding cassette domain-containing protein [Caldimonas tepidiphila]